MGSRVVLNQGALRKHLASSAQAQAALDGAVAALRAQAEREAPVHTGYFQDRFVTRRFPLSRRLGNTDPFAHLVEWGSANNRPYAPFRRAAHALGFKFRENAK